jgi:hypothetical protein
LVVEDITIKDCAIKETLRWSRIRQLMLMKNFAEKMAENRRNHAMNEEVMIKEE